MTGADFDLDVRGLHCPLPILHTKSRLAEMAPGQTLRVLATDPGAVKDFTAHAEHSTDELLDSTEENGEYRFVLRKGA